MAIPLVKESEEHIKQFHGIIEDCYFRCGNQTRFWHWRTNQPVCQSCAKKHKVSELKKSHPKYKPVTKSEYTKTN